MDANRDGRSDALIVDPRSRQVQAFLAQADGTLAARPVASPLPVGATTGELLVGDLDRDRIPDLIVYSGASLARLRGDGTGHFVDGIVTTGTFEQLELGDLDGDSRLDVVVLPQAGQGLLVGRGLGDGTLAPVVALAPAVAVDSFTLGDLDQDGLPDLVGAVAATGEVVLLAHDQALDRGSLRRITIATAACAAPPITALHTGDFTGDRLLDVLVLCGRDATVLRGRGDGRFEALPVSLGGAAAQTRVAVADYDGDLRADVALLLGSVFDVRLLAGDPQAGLRLLPTPVLSKPATGLTLFRLASGDVDGDSRPDLLLGNRLTNVPPQTFVLRNSSP